MYVEGAMEQVFMGLLAAGGVILLSWFLEVFIFPSLWPPSPTRKKGV